MHNRAFRPPAETVEPRARRARIAQARFGVSPPKDAAPRRMAPAKAPPLGRPRRRVTMPARPRGTERPGRPPAHHAKATRGDGQARPPAWPLAKRGPPGGAERGASGLCRPSWASSSAARVAPGEAWAAPPGGAPENRPGFPLTPAAGIGLLALAMKIHLPTKSKLGPRRGEHPLGVSSSQPRPGASFLRGGASWWTFRSARR